MRKSIVFVTLILISFGFKPYGHLKLATKSGNNQLEIVFIRHGEKPENGNNLTCKGLNRALLLPGVIQNKFGVPGYVYVPRLKMGDKTTRARMFETAEPLAVKFNLDINSRFEEEDSVGMAQELLQMKGVVLVVWEHKAISGIIHQLGISDRIKWKGDDYNTILIVAFQNGTPALIEDNEGLYPADDCP